MSLTISKKGWVVIPAELRKKYQLAPGTEVIIVDYAAFFPSSLPCAIRSNRGADD
jgi:AbrB family looped-hinge helix DNA binding protein